MMSRNRTSGRKGEHVIWELGRPGNGECALAGQGRAGQDRGRIFGNWIGREGKGGEIELRLMRG